MTNAPSAQSLHPGIGLLTRHGYSVAYAFINGIYLEGSITVLTAKLTRPGSR